MLIPFTLIIGETYASFPFYFKGKPVVLIKNNPAPSCLISNRKAGDMIFRLSNQQPPGTNKNREVFFSTLGIPAEKVYSLFQIHSRNVFLPGNLPGSKHALSIPLVLPEIFAQEGDGMVSFFSGLYLAVTVADCLPVFLLDTENGFFAVLHSGWKGTGIVTNALEIMKKAGSRPEMISAVLGPCIQSCCYKVNEERAKNFELEFGLASSKSDAVDPDRFPLGPVIRSGSSGWYISLQAANARLLAAAGVQNIAYCTDCTFTDTRLGSFRREGESYTRMIAMAGNIP